MADWPSDGWIASVRRELEENILPFWRNHAVDHEYGGFVAELANDLTPRPGATKGLILNARILWSFSAAHAWTRDPHDAELAHRAYAYIQHHFLDKAHGGYYWELAPGGECLNATKKTYGQAFAIYALAEYAVVFANSEAMDAARAAYQLIEANARDPVHDGYWEACARDWSPTAEMRLSDKDEDAPKSMNNHLHIVESYTRLHQIDPDPGLTDSIRSLLELFLTKISTHQGRHLGHFFLADWTPTGHAYTFGHDIEASWLLCEAVEQISDPQLRSKVESLAGNLAQSAFEQGLDTDGGLLYAGRDGLIIDDHKEWWPQAEAVVGFVNSHNMTGESHFFDAATGCWRFIESRIVDRQNGEWFWRVDRAGHPDPNLPKLSFWKCPYHNTRACLEILKRNS